MKRAHNRCEYLDTVARSTLDFDKARVCSATLADTNVYACCVCGKFFRGRGKSTPAYAHAIDEDHHVFVNLETTALYCLPDLYEVQVRVPPPPPLLLPLTPYGAPATALPVLLLVFPSTHSHIAPLPPAGVVSR